MIYFLLLFFFLYFLINFGIIIIIIKHINNNIKYFTSLHTSSFEELLHSNEKSIELFVAFVVFDVFDVIILYNKLRFYFSIKIQKSESSESDEKANFEESLL